MEEFNFVEESTSENGTQKKILIAVTVVLVVLCGVLGYMWHKTDSELDVNIEESKAALAASAQDLLDLQEAYSGLSIQYDTINMQLDSSRMEVELLMQKLQDERKISNATIKQYQKELGTLRTIMKGYIVQIDSLQKLNTKLTADAAAARQEAAASRKKTEELAAFLTSNGVSASFYHAGLGQQSRTDRQEQWKSDKIRVMVCTNAFGMGIDKPDVRFVIHFDVPDSPEAYFQEAGRGGRDGKRSFAVMLWNNTDVKRLRQLETVSFPSLEYIEDIYHKVHIFYQIPYDAGVGRQLKFDLEEFCRHFKLQRSPVYYAIQYIEKTNHWTYSEDVDISTKVQIMVDRNDLYDIEFQNPRLTYLLEVLMRRYTGLYSYPIPIDEAYVASQVGVQVPMLRQMLYQLSLEHVIRYVPCDHATVIFLHHDRLRPKNVNLDPKRYAMLKSSFGERMQKMIDYISEEDTCRSAYLLEYFGQSESADCGTCDICRAVKSANPSLEKEMAAYINDEMSGNYTIDDILGRFAAPGHYSPDDCISTLRKLIDSSSVPQHSN
jgi:ATP-dependent DNA helicase RecQ